MSSFRRPLSVVRLDGVADVGLVAKQACFCGPEVGQPGLLHAIRAAIESALTARQRLVLVALVLDDVPIDVLAERLGTTRGALYKTLHDGRRTLRRRLADDGYDINDVLQENE